MHAAWPAWRNRQHVGFDACRLHPLILQCSMHPDHRWTTVRRLCLLPTRWHLLQALVQYMARDEFWSDIQAGGGADNSDDNLRRTSRVRCRFILAASIYVGSKHLFWQQASRISEAPWSARSADTSVRLHVQVSWECNHG